MTPDDLRSGAQAALGELAQEGPLPFPLEARRLDPEGDSRYAIYFHDSRLRSVTVSWEEGQSFKDVVRAAVLDEVSRLHEPYH